LKTEVAALNELQALDLEILELRKELEAIPENLKAMEGDVRAVANLLQREKDRLEESEEWRVERERDIGMQNELLAKSKTKQQIARKERELKAAQREVDTIRKNIQEREEETIQLLEAIEQSRNVIEDHSKAFKELEDQLADSQKEGNKRMAEGEAKIGKTASRRKELADCVPRQTLSLYERIHKRLGRAVVEAVEGKCTGCNLGILPQMYIEIQRGEKVFQCSNCYRILFFEPKEEPDVNP
jgi:uncharacterized protein